MNDPVEECLAIAVIGAAHEREKIEAPAFQIGVTGIPDIEDEKRAMGFAGRSAVEESVKFIGIKFGRVVEPVTYFDRKAGKSADEIEDISVGVEPEFLRGNGVHRVKSLGPNLDGKTFGRIDRLGRLVRSLKHEEIGVLVFASLNLERDASGQKPIERNGIFE